MPKSILVEEFHLSIFAPRSLPEKQYHSMRRTLDATSFRARLRSAVQEVFKRYPSLGKVTVTITR